MNTPGQGRQVKQLSLQPGRYEYRFVADVQWPCGPAAGESPTNGYGSCNSVLAVPAGETALAAI